MSVQMTWDLVQGHSSFAVTLNLLNTHTRKDRTFAAKGTVHVVDPLYFLHHFVSFAVNTLGHDGIYLPKLVNARLIAEEIHLSL